MNIKPEPDDPNRPQEKKPPKLDTMDNLFMREVVKRMRELGIEAGQIRGDWKDFMRYAWAAENDVRVQDVMLVEEKLDPYRTVWFFAEKLPRDGAFAIKYQAMLAETTNTRMENCQLRNKIAALESELANIRGDR